MEIESSNPYLSSLTTSSDNTLIIRNEIDLTGNINGAIDSYASNIINTSKNTILLDSGISLPLSKKTNHAKLWHLYYFNTYDSIKIELNDFNNANYLKEYSNSNKLDYKTKFFKDLKSTKIINNNFRIIQC